MRTSVFALLGLLLSGCATITPGDLREREPTYVTRVGSAPDNAAACIAEQLDETRAPATHRVVVHRDRGSAEVIGSEANQTTVVITLQDIGGVTFVSVRRPKPLIDLEGDTNYKKAIDACSPGDRPV